MEVGSDGYIGYFFFRTYLNARFSIAFLSICHPFKFAGNLAQ